MIVHATILITMICSVHSYTNSIVAPDPAIRSSPVGGGGVRSAFAFKKVLVTGGTGFVGLRTISKLLGSTDIEQVSVAVRAQSKQAAHKRMHNLIQKHQQLGIHHHLDRLNIVHCDGNEIPVQQDDSFDALLNLDADTSWTKPLDAMMKANHDPLVNMMKQGRAPKHVIHCSTAFACPLEKVRNGHYLKERPFPRGETFFSPYAESKYRTEREIEKFVATESGKTCPRFSIVRPAAVGASVGIDGLERGWTTDHKSVAGRMYLLTHPKLPFVRKLHAAPVTPSYRSNIVPVDFVANSLILALYESLLSEENNNNSSSRSTNKQKQHNNSVRYLHTAPDVSFQNPTNAEVIRAYNNDIPIFDDCLRTFFHNGQNKKNPAMANAQVLLKITSVPFLFQSQEQRTSLNRLLTAEEKRTFPLAWEQQSDVLQYIKESADTTVWAMMGKGAIVATGASLFSSLANEAEFSNYK